MASPKTIKPPALRQGDKIGLIAPASSFNRESFLAGCNRLRQMGYEPVYSADIFDRDIYFAGTAERLPVFFGLVGVEGAEAGERFGEGFSIAEVTGDHERVA